MKRILEEVLPPISLCVVALVLVLSLCSKYQSKPELVEVGKWYWTEYEGNYYQCKVMKGPEKGKYLVLVDYYTGDKYTLKESSDLYFKLESKEYLENQ